MAVRNEKMKILIFGRGVIGTLYGWALEKAGHSVEFYVRPGRAAEYGSVLPMKFYDARTKLKGELVEENWAIRMREDLPADHDYELILVSVQHYHFEDVSAFLGPRIGKATLLIFSNFWKDPQASASSLPRDQIAWGFPLAGGGFRKDGVLGGLFFAGSSSEPSAPIRRRGNWQSMICSGRVVSRFNNTATSGDGCGAISSWTPGFSRRPYRQAGRSSW